MKAEVKADASVHLGRTVSGTAEAAKVHVLLICDPPCERYRLAVRTGFSEVRGVQESSLLVLASYIGWSFCCLTFVAFVWVRMATPSCRVWPLA